MTYWLLKYIYPIIYTFSLCVGPTNRFMDITNCEYTYVQGIRSALLASWPIVRRPFIHIVT